MKIIKLSAENFKKLRAVEITPTGALVEITGRNGAGKTSVLDAIWAALGGTAHIQAVPIRRGADKARIRLDLGDLVVERRFTPKGSTLAVESADGARYTSPQTMLDALLGALTFDPLAFVHQEPRAQFETLRTIAPLDVDIDKLDGLNRTDFAQRADINREARAKRAQADGISIPTGLAVEPTDTGALMDRLTSASTVNAEIAGRRSARQEEAVKIVDWRTDAMEQRDRARELRDEADRCDAKAATLDDRARVHQEQLAAAEPLPDPINAEAIRRELETAQATNRAIEQRERQAALLEEALQLEAQGKKLTSTMEARATEKADAIARAAMPVPGLGFGDGLVTFNGVPFEQASSAEQLQVSVAIAMAANPKLRVIRIKEGSLLDADNIALIAEMAKMHDYQIWLERVDASGKVGVVIEDGSVVAVNG